MSNCCVICLPISKSSGSNMLLVLLAVVTNRIEDMNGNVVVDFYRATPRRKLRKIDRYKMFFENISFQRFKLSSSEHFFLPNLFTKRMFFYLQQENDPCYRQTKTIFDRQLSVRSAVANYFFVNVVSTISFLSQRLVFYQSFR